MPAAQLSDEPSAPADAILPAWRRRLRDWLPVLLIVLVASVAYWNAWPDRLVHDDKFFAGSERFAALTNIPRYFLEGAWATSGIDEDLYRPLLLVSITLDARAWGDWLAGYHLTNIALHALVCVLLYGFLRQVLRMHHGPSPMDWAAALAVTLIFAVHPVGTETVNSVFNRSEMLVALAGVAGLTWFLRRLDAQPARAWAGLGLAYLLALFCKESAITLPGIAVALALALASGDLPARVRKCLPVLWLLVPLAFYLALRAHALAPIDDSGLAKTVSGTAGARGVEAMLDQFRIPDGRRLARVAGLWYESFKILVWPHPLSIAPSDIPPPARFAGMVVNLALVTIAVLLARRRQYGLAIGLVFFYLASLPSSRIVGEPGMVPHLAERYLYLPSIGLALAVAFGLRRLAHRHGLAVLAGIALPIVLLFTPLTWARNAVWASEIQLFESDYRHRQDSGRLLVWLTAAHLLEFHFERVVEICDRHLDGPLRSGPLSTHCATAYGRVGRLREAEDAYLFATRDGTSTSGAHTNLANFYLSQGRWRDAKEQFERAVEAEDLPARRELRQGLMLIHLYPADRDKLLEGKAHFERALALQPAFGQAQEWLARVNRTLDRLPPEQP